MLDKVMCFFDVCFMIGDMCGYTLYSFYFRDTCLFEYKVYDTKEKYFTFGSFWDKGI